MPKVLITTQVYPPEIHPTAVMVRELAEYLAANGWDVTVCAGWPHHPEGRIYSGFTRKLWSKSMQNGVTVLRAWHWLSPSRSMLARGAVFVSQAMAAAAAAMLVPACDVVLVYGPPLVGANLGALVAARHGAKLANIVYDIYPDIAVETGKVTSPLIIGPARLAEWLQYRASDLTIVLSDGFKKQLVKKGVPEEKIAIIPVWLDPDEITPGPRDNEWRKEQGIPLDKFVVLYAGTIGIVSGAAMVADAASLLKDRDDILFLFVGEGEEKANVESRARELGLTNMVFLPFQPREKLSKVQATADIGLVTLLPGRGRTSVPSKVQGYMAAGRPVLGSVDEDSDTARLISDGRFGQVVASANAGKLADAIVGMSKTEKERKKMGGYARRILEKHFSKNMLLRQYDEDLRRVLI